MRFSVILKDQGPLPTGSGGSTLFPVQWVHQNMPRAPRYMFRICQMKSLEMHIGHIGLCINRPKQYGGLKGLLGFLFPTHLHHVKECPLKSEILSISAALTANGCES